MLLETIDERINKRNYIKYLGAFAVGAVVGYISRELAESYGLIPGLATTATQTATHTLTKTRTLTQTQTVTERITETITEITMETVIKSIEELFDAYLTEIGKLYPELCEELKKLPDFKGIDAKDVEVLDDVKYLANLNYNKIFRPMLEEGIPDKRKYCTPLEALIWILYDKEPGDPTITSLLEDPIGLTKYSWRNSSVSNNYKSDRWKNFDEARDRVNSPELINLFIFDYLTFDMHRDSIHPQNIYTTYKIRRGVCRHAAALSTDFLVHNGYNGKNLTVLYALNKGHSVSTIDTKDGIYIIVDFRGRYLPITGPFKTYNDAAQYIAKSFGWGEIWKIFVENNYQLQSRNNDL